MYAILANKVARTSELIQHPDAVLSIAAEEPVAILKRNRPVGYIISPALWEGILDRLDDAKMAAISIERLTDGEAHVPVRLEQL